MEDLITTPGKTRLDLSVAYSNTERQGISTGEPFILQTGPTSFIAVPTQIGESIGNSDTSVITIGVRRGLSSKAEIYGRLSAHSSTQRSSTATQSTTQSSSGFADAWVGINYQFKNDENTPALLGFAEIALRERHRNSSASFKSTMVGATTYKAIDPIVFSLTGAYRYNQTRQDGGRPYKPGNLILLNPGVAFAVNDRITLTTGMQWTRRHADRITGQTQGIHRTATDLLLGVGYGFDKGNTLNTTFKVNASGRSGAELRLNWLTTF
ncbi:hypothetical protein [Hydrogenophaga sp.]|uniref:hypothetical protein n=1 Tax=Hydrogenophaga sp. TaxID=1904254 RepID=UPI0035ADEABD